MNTSKIVKGALGIAAIFIFTAFVSFPVGGFGYINLGDSMIMLFANAFSPLMALLVSAIASSMADISLGFAQYALFTFIIKGCEALVISYLLKKNQMKARWWIFMLGGVIVLVGYGLSDVLLTGNWLIFVESILFNLIQVITSILIAYIAYPYFMKVIKKYM